MSLGDPCCVELIAAAQIPCTEANLRAIEWRIDHKVPTEIRDNAPNIIAQGGTIYDLWLNEAEALIANDLLKMAQPIRLDRIENLGQLTRLKAIKTCELLFRKDAIEVEDLNDKRAEYFASLYLAELSSLPLRIYAGAQLIPKYGMIRG